MKPDSTWDDTQLILAFRDGDQEAWSTLCQRYRVHLRQFFYLKGITNPEDLNDLSQETLLEAMKNIDKLQSPKSFNGWLGSIATGTMGKWIRKEDRNREFQEAINIRANVSVTGVLLAPTYLGPEQQVIDDEYIHIIFSMIERLPPSEEKVLRMHYDGKKNTEIVVELGISVNAVNVRLSKAKKKLRGWIEAEYPEIHADLVERGIM